MISNLSNYNYDFSKLTFIVKLLKKHIIACCLLEVIACLVYTF